MGSDGLANSLDLLVCSYLVKLKKKFFFFFFSKCLSGSVTLVCVGWRAQLYLCFPSDKLYFFFIFFLVSKISSTFTVFVFIISFALLSHRGSGNKSNNIFLFFFLRVLEPGSPTFTPPLLIAQSCSPQQHFLVASFELVFF